MLGPSPSAFAAAGVWGWGEECGGFCTVGHRSSEWESDSQPPCSVPGHLVTPRSALWTGRVMRRVVLVQTALGKAQRSDPSSNCRASGMLLRSLWSSRGERQKQQVRAAGRSWVTGMQAARGQAYPYCHGKQPKLICPHTQEYRAATSPCSDSSL